MRAGKGGTYREVPVHPQLRPDLALWINDERPAWKGSARTSALLLNHRGARLGARGADGILGAIADEAHLTDEFTTHVLRHTFGTTLERGPGRPPPPLNPPYQFPPRPRPRPRRRTHGPQAIGSNTPVQPAHPGRPRTRDRQPAQRPLTSTLQDLRRVSGVFRSYP